MVKTLLLTFLMALAANAKTVTFGADEVSVSIRFVKSESSSETAPTYLRFPRAIARIDNATMFSVKAASANGIQPDYREIEVRPRVNEGSQKIEVLLNDGTIVRLKLNITANSEAPVSYDFEPRRTHELSKSQGLQSQGQIADLSVMRTVLEGITPAGFSKKNFSMMVSCSGIGPNARLVHVLENNQFKIFQIEIANDSNKKSFVIKEENVVIKIRDLGRSPLIHIRSNVLGPSGKGASRTMMTILSDPSANINRMRVCDLGDQIEALEIKSKAQK